ncbi:hypothetical protein SERLADRAFT_392337 [Serpula lacrymans var. lacrymans S7.9]|uniref:Uncharacterized protein n=1 Tax=Serpula lacrymans var. lacrymans (strain S7.9) TaxID=578457 RepID=F8NZ18_SERL9|nr:uncharacterized protein SERLADRAFT_392337 [Serpula lacrymans var. lacrymans S7.9]EGO23838.1 hypothetical protein SERLADRAFT_392337 [Serpula lacrymans var. lacrymans S7.9]
MNDIKDVMLFGLTLDIRAHWAGDRIICIGDGTWDADLPEAEIQDLGLDRKSDQDGFLSDHTLYNVAATYFCKPPVLPHIYKVFAAGNREDHFYLKAFPTRAERDILSRLLEQVYALEEEALVLANLTKREYVRVSLILDLKEFLPASSNAPLVGRNMTLGSVLVHRIGLPCDISVCEYNDDTGGDAHHGVWVGELAISTISELNQDKGEKEWKDIISEVIEETIEMWKKEFNYDWESRL